LIVDIKVDTGPTIAQHSASLSPSSARHPASIKVCSSLLPRPDEEVPIDYLGFVDREDRFVVGHGPTGPSVTAILPFIGVVEAKESSASPSSRR
jgi:hypoxanthine-guanine phosphoribosyltransferase